PSIEDPLNPDNADPIPVEETTNFDSVVLMGILYKQNDPMALIDTGKAEAGSGPTTRMVRKGDVVSTDGGTIEIQEISRTHIELKDVVNPDRRLTLPLPNIVGYNKGVNQGSPSSGEAPASPESNIINELLET